MRGPVRSRELAIGFVLLLGAIVTAITVGCGGGGSHSPMAAGTPADTAAIRQSVTGFALALGSGDATSAAQYYSPRMRLAAVTDPAAQSLIVHEFGRDIHDPTDDATFTFQIPADGVTFLGEGLARVIARGGLGDGNSAQMTFTMVLIEGFWYIDDIQIAIEAKGDLPIASYYPLRTGNSWRYQLLDDTGAVIPNQSRLRSISEAPALVGGRPFFAVTDEVSSTGGGAVRSTVRGAMFDVAGKPSYSNQGGLYLLADSDAFNRGQPWQILPVDVRPGLVATSTVPMRVNGTAATATFRVEVKPLVAMTTPVRTFSALPIEITADVVSGTTVTRQRETWYVADGIGLVARSLSADNQVDRLIGRELLTAATVNGVVYNPPVTFTGTGVDTGSATGTLTGTDTGSGTTTLTGTDTQTDTSTTTGTDTGAAASNVPPTFTVAQSVITINEDAGPQDIAGAIQNLSPGRAEETSQQLTAAIEVTNPSLYASNAAPLLSLSTTSWDGRLSFTTAANAHGISTLTIVVADDGSGSTAGPATSTPATITVQVLSVNDPPTFSMGDDLEVVSPGPYQEAWATNISAGPADEQGQSLEFEVAVDRPDLFTSSGEPAIDAAGVLTFAFKSEAYGTALVTVKLKDSGGTDRGGADTSAEETFKITYRRTAATSITWAPTGMPGRAAHAAVGLGARLFVIGGRSDSAGSSLSSNLMLDLVTRTWHTKTPLQTARRHFGAVPISGNIWVAGGETAPGVFTAAVDSYDPGGDAWTSQVALPKPGKGWHLVVADGRLFAVGGVDGTGPIGEIYEAMPSGTLPPTGWQLRGRMSQPRWGAAVAAVGTRIYIFGGATGLESSPSFLTNAEKFDVTTNAFTTIGAGMVDPRHSFTATPDKNGNVFLIGGVGSLGAATATQRFNPADDSFSEVAEHPRPTALHAALPSDPAGDGNFVFLVGGVTPPTSDDGRPDIWYYDVTRNSYGEYTREPAGSTRGGLAYLGGKVYRIGGISRSGVSSEVWVFDPSNRVWSPAPSLQEPRFGFGTAVLDGKIYIMGGKTSLAGMPTTDVRVFDPNSQVWQTLPPLGTARVDLGAAAINGQVFAIGGRSGTNVLNVIEAYDPQSNDWTTMAPMPTARAGLMVAPANGRIYAIGGDRSMSAVMSTNAVEAYDPVHDQWEQLLAHPPTSITDAAVAVYADRILILGGNASSIGASVNEFDAVSSQWTQKGDLQFARQYHSAVAYPADNGPEIMVIGGANPLGDVLDRGIEIGEID